MVPHLNLSLKISTSDRTPRTRIPARAWPLPIEVLQCLSFFLAMLCAGVSCVVPGMPIPPAVRVVCLFAVRQAMGLFPQKKKTRAHGHARPTGPETPRAEAQNSNTRTHTRQTDLTLTHARTHTQPCTHAHARTHGGGGHGGGGYGGEGGGGKGGGSAHHITWQSHG